MLEAGEILTEVILPPPPAGARGGYYKVRSRGAWDFALAGVASALQVDGGVVKRARLVFSGVAPVPWRAPAAEKELVGGRLDDAAIARSAAAAPRTSGALFSFRAMARW